MTVVGVGSATSVTRDVAGELSRRLEEAGVEVDILDLGQEPLSPLDPQTTYSAPFYGPLRERAVAADVFLLATPDYHGSMSGSLKVFLDHFWREYAGKLFATLVSSYDKGLTVADQIRTVARQCYAWSMPYAVSFQEKRDATPGLEDLSPELDQRLTMMARDISVYGSMLADRRRLDLAGDDPGFLAHYRARA